MKIERTNQRNPHKPSIRTLAAASGYSAATVSMALRGLGRIPPETRKKIEEAAAESGYMRDLEMSRLMSRARRPEQAVEREVLAFLAEVPIGPKPDPRSPWLHGMFHAARAAVRLQGCDLEHVTIGPDPRSQKALSRSLPRRGEALDRVGLKQLPPPDPEKWTSWPPKGILLSSAALLGC